MQAIMTTAWEIARKTAKECDVKVGQVDFGACLKMAWAQSRKPNLVVTQKCGCKRQVNEIAYKICGDSLLRDFESVECDNCKPKEVEVPVYVVGQTYYNRSKLKSLGLLWNPGCQAWVGECKLSAIPSGCRNVSQGEAALRSMDHAHSDY